MTSSKKKHHPPATPTVSRTSRPTTPARVVTRREWTIRAIAVLGVIAGGTMTLIGATPDILGGYGKLLLMVPGMIIVAGSLVAFVETTSHARSLRRLPR